MSLSDFKPLLKNKKKRHHDTSSSKYHELTTSDDYLNQGVEEEESGDRFTLSDLSKSLRFYQKAYEYYLQAAEIDQFNSINALDSMYNSCRLLFHIYNEFIKDETVNFQYDLKSIEQVVNSDYSVLQSLDSICEQHERAVTAYQRFFSEGENNDEVLVPWDLYSNLCLVYTELIETTTDLSADSLKRYIERTISLYDIILKYQVSELQKIINECDSSDYNNSSQEIENDYAEDSNKDEEFASQESIIPSTVLETVICGYSFIQSSYEVFRQESNNNSTISSMSFKGLLEYSEPLFDAFSKRLNRISNDLQVRFPPIANRDVSQEQQQASIIQPLCWEDLVNLEITKTFIKSLTGNYCNNSIEKFNKLWCETVDNIIGNRAASDTLFVKTEMNTIVADSYQIFLDNNNSKGNLSPEDAWKTLSTMSAYFKKSQDGLSSTLKEVQERARRNPNESAELSKLISKFVKVIISRVDIDVDKVYSSRFEGLQIREVQRDALKKNIEVNLKNCLRYLGMNVGLRESIFDKLARREKKYEVMVRQYVLGLVGNEAMKVSNLGEKELIRSEFQSLKQNEVYLGFQFPF